MPAEPLLEVPLTIGHEENQEFTGAPAVGWITNVYRKGRKLFADVAGIFPKVSDLVRAKAYKHISAELYPKDQSPEGIPSDGVMLRRVALLGASIPHVKTLADVPEPGDGQDFIEGIEIFDSGIHQGEYYSEKDLQDIADNFNRFSRPTRQFTERSRSKAPRVDLTPGKRVWHSLERVWACFSEVRVRAMADDAVQQVAEAAIMAAFPGLPPELIASMTPEQMEMIAAAMPAAVPPADEMMPEEDGAMPMAEWPEGMDRAAVEAALVEQGQDPAALQAMSDDELIAMWMEIQGQQGGGMPGGPDMMAEYPAPLEDSTMTAPTPQATPASKRLPKKLTTTAQFSEAALEQAVTRAVAKIITPFRQEVASARKTEQRRLKETHRERVRAFCEVLRQNGQVSPAEVDFDATTGQPLGPVALSLMLASPVKKFSETESDFDRLIASYKKLPAHKFGEQVPDPIQNNRDTMTQDRRDYLLGLTSRGKAVLQKESAQKQSAKMFAEVIGDALKGHLNGK